MRPYYEENGIVIYNSDCREILPQLGPVDVVITDPPYGVNLTVKSNDFRGSRYFDDGESLKASATYLDDERSITELLTTVIPIALAKAARAAIFTGTRLLQVYPSAAAMGCVFVSNGAGRDRWGFGCFQPILYYGKDPYLAIGKGSRPNSFADNQPNLEKIDHPCPKPMSWMRWLVSRASLEGELILDPFMGSGTTLVAAKNLGRKAIGIEIEERYCEIAVKRLAQSVMQFGESR